MPVKQFGARQEQLDPTGKYGIPKVPFSLNTAASIQQLQHIEHQPHDHAVSSQLATSTPSYMPIISPPLRQKEADYPYTK